MTAVLLLTLVALTPEAAGNDAAVRAAIDRAAVERLGPGADVSVRELQIECDSRQWSHRCGARTGGARRPAERVLADGANIVRTAPDRIGGRHDRRRRRRIFAFAATSGAARS